MRATVKTSEVVRGMAALIFHALAIMISITLFFNVAGCDYVSKWRDSQIATTHKLAKGTRIDPPAKPIEVDDSIYDDLPLQRDWTIVSYSDSGQVKVMTLSKQDTTATTEWVLSRMAELGYSAEDNASRILEGLTFTKPGGKYPSVYVKVDLNTADQTTVEVETSPQP